jgi:hypothetical protein
MRTLKNSSTALVVVLVTSMAVLGLVGAASGGVPTAATESGVLWSTGNTASIAWSSAARGISRVGAATYSNPTCTRLIRSGSTVLEPGLNFHSGAVRIPGNYAIGRTYYIRVNKVVASGWATPPSARCRSFVPTTVANASALSAPIMQPGVGQLTFSWMPSLFGSGSATYYKWTVSSSDGSCQGSGATEELFVTCKGNVGATYTLSVYATNSLAPGAPSSLTSTQVITVPAAGVTTTTVKGTTTTLTNTPTTSTTSTTTTSTTTTTVPYVYTCNADDTLNGSTCTHTTTYSATATEAYLCAAGWTLSGTQCVDYITVTQAKCVNNGDTWLGGSINNCEKEIAATSYVEFTCNGSDVLNVETCTNVYTYSAAYGPKKS